MTAAAVQGPACPVLRMAPGMQLVLEMIIVSPSLFFLPVPAFPAGWRQLVLLQSWWESFQSPVSAKYGVTLCVS